LRAIARAAAGRFDHYICRRDDNLRNRGPEEVPRILAAELLASGIAADAISVIPDEQEAVDAALQMGRPGDLLLIFADALTRSWTQIIRFKPADAPAAAADQPIVVTAPPSVGGPSADPFVRELKLPSLEGLIRDERGIRFAPESDD
ncbi:MAG TPA: hypothetical protein VLT59_17090, partial [Steroidobacteraceae bacterium]|nr:hypothetical protein [Steroidobacteraceae bacterium]